METVRGSIKSYVLRAGRMTPAQKRARDQLFSRFGISREDLQPASVSSAGRFEALSGGVSPAGAGALAGARSGTPEAASPAAFFSLQALLEPPAPLPAASDNLFTQLFGNHNPVIVEIGFGMGIATAMIAERNPQKNYLGIEVFRPGVGRLLWEIERRRLANVRVVEHDAAEIVPCLPPRSLAGIHLFFPDPWPKKRHHKRRLVTWPFTELLASRLEQAGYLYMVTDWEDYARWALEELSKTPGLENPWAGRAGEGFAPPQSWRPETKFEKKGLEEQRRVWELYFTASIDPSIASKQTGGRGGPRRSA